MGEVESFQVVTEIVAFHGVLYEEKGFCKSFLFFPLEVVYKLFKGLIYVVSCCFCICSYFCDMMFW